MKEKKINSGVLAGVYNQAFYVNNGMV